MTLGWLGHLLTTLFFVGDLARCGAAGVPCAVWRCATACRGGAGRRRVAGAAAAAVTVLIPAYNEAKVIVGSVRRMLASDYPNWRSSSSTTDRPTTPRTWCASISATTRASRLITSQRRQGARAQRGLADARGEVVVALDADTQFQREPSPGWCAGSPIRRSAPSPATPRSATAST